MKLKRVLAHEVEYIFYIFRMTNHLVLKRRHITDIAMGNIFKKCILYDSENWILNQGYF